MSIRKTSILALSLFTLIVSCISSDKTIGDKLIPGDYILKITTDTLDLDIINKVPDSIQSRSSSYMIIGQLISPEFGVTSSATVAQILPLDTNNFGENPVLKSIILTLDVGKVKNYSPEYDGIAQNISVHKLTKTIDATRLFNNSFTSDDYDPTPIHVGAPVYYGGKTIEITLSNTFGKELLSITSEEFEDLDKFVEKIKGLYITTGIPNNAEGGRLNYLTVGGGSDAYGYPTLASTITLNYLLTDKDQEIESRDTTAVFAVGYNFALNQIKSGSGSLASDDPEETLYIDGFSGVKPYINGKQLKDQISELLSDEKYAGKSIIISNASIDLPFEMPNNYKELKSRYPQNIYPCYIDSTGYIQPLDDIFYSTRIGTMENSLLLYSSDVTLYIQNLIKKDVSEVGKSDDIWFSSLLSITQRDAYGNPTAPDYIFDDQTYYSGSINGPLAARKPKLSLVFTVLSD